LGPEVLRIYAEKADGGNFILKRGFDKLVTNKRVLVVEDILNTGGSVASVIRAVQDAGGTVVAVAAICNRGGVTADQLQVPQLVSLVNVTMESWEAKDCPLCRDNVPINTKVGHGAQFLAAQNQVVN
jgi:orotate phosphoribosyltransferase